MVRLIVHLFVFVICFYDRAFAQKTLIDPSNTRFGETVEYCHTHKRMNELKKNPEFLKAYEKQEAELQKILLSKGAVPKGNVYTIPVVFHVLHYNGPENISDEQIYDALNVLNSDFRLKNADAALVQPEFQGMPADAEIEFALAKKAPDGSCFKGITRTANAITFSGDDNQGLNQVNAIINGNDVYRQAWPGNKYLNIFICADVGTAAGYTFNPSVSRATNMANGIWIEHNYVGSIGTSNAYRSRTLTHEVGHWLNLFHTWGPNNNPGNPASCSSGDNVDDTPNCIGVNDCALNSNTCNDGPNDLKDNVENFMEYSYCTKMFTQGQVDRMRASLQLTSTGRYNVWQPSNLTAVGVFDSPTICKAEFTSNKTAVCAGESITFADETYKMVNGWNWSFDGGTPASSAMQNPTTLYHTPGIYGVTLKASYEGKSDTEIKTGYIRVLPKPAVVPYFEGFENYTSLSNLTNWEVYNSAINNTFVLDNTRGHSGAKCVKLMNFGETGANVDELISAPIDLSKVPVNGNLVTLSFRYAYRKKVSTDQEKLVVYASGDCGDNWVIRRVLTGNSLSSLISTSSWAPASKMDWTTVHLTNINDLYWKNNFRFKLSFEGNGGNNIYLDDINIYYGTPSDNIVLSLEEPQGIEGLSLYPNPSEGEISLRFDVQEPQKLLVQITDVAGKVMEAHSIHADSGANVVLFDTQKFSAGTYFMNITSGNGRNALPFVVR